MEYKKFSLEDLFVPQNGDFDIQQKHINGNGIFVVSSGETNTGVIGKSDVSARVFKKNTITVDMFGYAYFRSYEYKMVTHARVFSLGLKNGEISREVGLYFVALLQFLKHNYSYNNMASWKKVKNEIIKLPTTKSGEIDFKHMEDRIRELQEDRIRELQAYLKVTGLSDCILSREEKELLRKFRGGGVSTAMFRIGDLFSNIEQGSRLTKGDQRKGNLPFVMSGVTNTGISNFISNPVKKYPKNSLTVDIFGNTFFRNYEYGMGDDTGSYWNNANPYTKNQMLYLVGSIRKSLNGKFDYSNKLRSSQSLDYKLSLPITPQNTPDLDLMEKFITAQNKLTIQNVVQWRDKQIVTTKGVITGK